MSRKKSIPEVFATICWFHEQRIRLQACTVVAVQRAIEPVSKERATAVRRRWSDYRNGRRKPSAPVVALAEKLVPGSKEIFHSPLWDALRLDKPAEKIARSLQKTTSSLGDDLLKWMLHPQECHNDPRWLHNRCKAMVAHGSLEGLAILTICMRLAGSAEQPRLALTFYLHAINCLMILGGWFYQNGIAQAIAEYYEKSILPACCSEHKLGTFSSDYYLESISVLARARMAAQEKTNRDLSHEEVISAMFKLFDL